MTTKEIMEQDRQYIMPTYARFPVALVRGEGARVYSPEGREYIDFTSGIGVTSLGHAHPAWVKAVTDQAGALAHVSNLYYTEPSARLAARLCRSAGMKQVFFANSGAEANEGAIKLARKYSFDKYAGTQRSSVLTLRQSFHGRTITTLSATGQDHFHQFFTPFTKGFAYTEATIGALETAMTDGVCALMIEIVQGEGGVLPLEAEFVHAAAALCAARDVLLIVDEVQTGVGRTGKMFAFEHLGLTPDIVTLAKGLGGGLPIGAFMCGEKCANVLGAGTHGSTFGANPVCTAAANAVLDVVDNADFLAGVEKKGAYIRERIGNMNIPFVNGMRGLGLMLGIVIGGGQSHKALAAALAEEGLLVLTAGQDAVRLLPSLTITYEEIDRGLAILERVFRAAAQEHKEGAQV